MEEKIKSPWPGPEGLIPVTSGRADDANLINRRYLDSMMVEMRVIGAVEPNLETEIFGRKFSSPIMMPAFSHLNKVGKNGQKPMEAYAEAAKEMNLLNWVGMEPDEEFAAIAAVGAPTVRIIKPFADHDLILEQIAFAEAHGAFAVGIDIDHIAGKDGHYDVVDGQPLGPVTQEDLAQYVKSTHLPFIAKGVLSPDDAIDAVRAGCKGLVISHHHGRIPFGVPPTYMLQKIVEVIYDPDLRYFVDCGIDTGYDAYKAMALGANAVAVGRGILAPLLKEGKDGVVKKVRKMNEQLSEMMMYTSVADTQSFRRSVIHML
jgi:4-hydroxymandelate oxidase